MFHIQLTEDPVRSFVTFDGLVLELFSESYEERRFHVRLIRSIELAPDKKGRHHLKIVTRVLNADREVDDGAVSEVMDLVAQVQKAMM